MKKFFISVSILAITGMILVSAQKNFQQTENISDSITNDKIISTAISSPKSDSLLLLVNNTNAIPGDYSFELTMLSNGIYINSMIYMDLQEMFDVMRSEGIYPVVGEGYRTEQQQCDMMQMYINDYISQGFSQQEAVELAKNYVAEPRHSEHETGLAVDINADDKNGSSNDEVYSWLSENAYKYGFILRYPQGKENITGINYEPWHYRYVGKKHAEKIFDEQLTLEEYLSS